MFVIVPLFMGGAGLIALLAIPKGVVPVALFAMGLYSIVFGTVAWTGKLGLYS
jgi:hypothetical protein